MKNLKIPEVIHDELKVFSAKNKESMAVIGGAAIVQYLTENGHKFAIKIKNNPFKKSKQ